MISSRLVHESQFDSDSDIGRANEQKSRGNPVALLKPWTVIQKRLNAFIARPEKSTMIRTDKLAFLNIFSKINLQEDTPNLAKSSLCGKITPLGTRVNGESFFSLETVNSSLEAFHGRLHLYCLITPCPLLCCDSWWRWNRFSSVTLCLLGFLTALVNSGVATLTVTMHPAARVFLGQSAKSHCGPKVALWQVSSLSRGN